MNNMANLLSNAANTIVGTVKSFIVLLVAVFGALIGFATILNGAGIPIPIFGGIGLPVASFGSAVLVAFATWALTLLALAFAELLPESV